MALLITAGLAASTTSGLSSTKPYVARAPQMRQMGIRQGYDCLLSRMSSSICDNATQFQRRDLERLGRRADAQCRFEDTLTGLKERIAWKTAVRTRSAAVDGIVELACKAS